MLEVKNLAVGYQGQDVLQDISFTLLDSEVLMFVGPTGCGKTTVLRALAGLVEPSAGSIRLGDKLIDADHPLPPEKRGVGMVFQDFALFPHLTVAQNVGFRLKNMAPARRWLKLLGLEPLQNAMPDTLSGGQKQRVSLARALAHEPALMLLDEPLSNLDAAMKDSLRWEIRDALKEAGVPAIWVTHDQEEALSVGDRVGILNGGRLEQLDTPENCFCMPTTRFVARFLGDAAFLPGRLVDGVVQTAVGSAPGHAVDGAESDVDLLVRSDDLSLTPAPANEANGEIEYGRYEGGSRLYTVKLRNGLRAKIRVSHEIRLVAGEGVRVALTTTHPLAAFRRTEAVDDVTLGLVEPSGAVPPAREAMKTGSG